jgi:hypothetical protein
MANIIDRTGETKIMKNGINTTIISYRKWEDIDVKFDDGYIAYNKDYGAFKKGSIKNPNIKTKSNNLINRLGEINYNIYGTKLEIIKYNNYDDVDVKIYDKDNTVIKNTRYNNFKSKHMFSTYDKTINNIGYIGKPIFSKDEETIPMCKLLSYLYWVGMIDRCYKNSNRLRTYEDKFVCEEWLNYSNFKIWFDKNYYEITNKKMQLDKDILVKRNKIYSPSTCIFVPNDINMLFVKADNIRGDLPIGVHHNRNRNCYASKLSINNKSKYLGRFTDAQEAFNVYKMHKEAYIKEVADQYKGSIPEKLYNAMMIYEVEITD